jgi:hypothetical protein
MFDAYTPGHHHKQTLFSPEGFHLTRFLPHSLQVIYTQRVSKHLLQQSIKTSSSLATCLHAISPPPPA